MTPRRATTLRTAAAGSIVTMLGTVGAIGAAHAAPGSPAVPAHGNDVKVVQSIYPVPHSKVAYGIATKGPAGGNGHFYLVSGKNGHFKKDWAPKLGGKYGHLDSVYAVSKNNVFIGGGVDANDHSGFEDSKVEIWHKVGKTITPTNFTKYNFGVGAVAVTQFAGSSPTDIWAIGSFYVNDTGGPQAMHWNGKNWSVVQVPQDENFDGLSSIAAISPNNAWGLRGDGHVLHWDGKAWTDTGPVLDISNGGFLRGSSAKNIYLSGTNAKGKHAIDRYNGKKWVQMKVKGWPVSSPIVAMNTVGKQGWALVTYLNAKDLSQGVILHTNGGKWTPEYKTHGGAWDFGDNSLEVSSAAHGLVLGSHGTGGYDSPYHPFSLQLHGHKWKKGSYHLAL